ncbi:MAG: hypothetical protein ABIR17_13050 [Pseudolysinimonas sp.]|uniref:hypothetical protein n=1 Tax=Pseudolysinimonas sp. TaxID=2680009 RepID=UPI00326368C7
MATYRQQDRSYTYENDWEAFTAKLAGYSPTKVESLVNDAKVDQKLAMIVALTGDWRAEYSTFDALRKLRQAQWRIIEERRMTPNPDAFRPYLDADTRALLPAIKLHRRYAEARRRDRAARDSFWNGIRSGKWRGRSIERIVARERRRITESFFAPPYGGPVTQAELNVLHDTFRTMRPVLAVKRPTIDPAGMTPERALAIARDVLVH